MKLKEIEELIDFIAKSGLGEVNVETEQVKLHIKRNLAVVQDLNLSKPSIVLPGSISLSPAPVTQPVSKAQADLSLTPDASINTDTITVKSPMIGTFYRSSKPENPPFVQEGDTVVAGKTICIIEAMKLFNEIEAEVAGTIVKVLVEDASPVEYDQPLFLIEPA